MAEKTGVSHQALGLEIVRKASNTEAPFSNKAERTRVSYGTFALSLQSFH